MKDLIERTSVCLAEVVVQTEHGWIRNGTAFAISADGRLATCAHVIDGFSDFQIKFWGNNDHQPARLVVQESARDLAILEVKDSLRPLPLGDFNQVDVGDDVVWGGFPSEIWLPSFHKGMISFKGSVPLPNAKGNPWGIQLDGTINRGMSGGPVIDPRDGRVVAVATASMGQLSERLRALARRREEGPVRTTVRASGVNLVEELQQLAVDMERFIQLGVGLGISVDYLSALSERTH